MYREILIPYHKCKFYFKDIGSKKKKLNKTKVKLISKDVMI